MFQIDISIFNLGEGFGLMTFSVIIADCIMVHCSHNKKLFQKFKELDMKNIYHDPETIEKSNDV